MVEVLALNSSPSMEKGFTAMILNPFLEGMKEKGANVELLYTRKLDIRPCLGCLSCHNETPRKCIQDDDAEVIHSKLSKAASLSWPARSTYSGSRDR